MPGVTDKVASSVVSLSAKRPPDFIGIGAQKAGTTWIYEKMRQHPGIAFPAGKEVHFWDKHISRGIPWYFSRFGAVPDKLAGDITPAYSILPRRCIERLLAACPDTHFFMVLRNPIDRAWSLAKMNAGHLLDTANSLGFEGQPGLKFDEIGDDWFIRQFNMHGSLVRGRYDFCLENWFSVVPPEQLLILDFDELRSEPKDFLARVHNHCGLDDDWLDKQPSEFFEKKVFGSAEHALPARLRAVLRELYADSIDRLGRLLDRDFSHWLR